MISLLFLLALTPIPEDYQLQINDEILITISGSVNFSYHQTVSPQGNIFIQSGKTTLEIIKVLNLNLGDTQVLIQDIFNKYFKDITVSVTITKFRDVVYVDGAVVIPGAYPFFPGKRARDYIGLAGGPLVSGDLESIKIITPNDGVITGKLDATPPRNATITIPHAYVYVRGAVGVPGGFPFDPALTASHYIGMAGGPTDRANLKGSYVVKRDGTKVSMEKANIDKGDIIIVRRVFLKWWEDYLTIGTAVTTVVIAWLTISR